MTSGNDTGQGTGSAATDIEQERDESQSAPPGAEPMDDTAEPVSGEQPAEKAENGQAAAAGTVAEKAETGGTPARDTAAERTAEDASSRASDSAGSAAPASGAAQQDPAARPGGIWRSAYEAGADARPKHFDSVTDDADPASSSPGEVDESTKPRVVSRGTLPVSPPSESQRPGPETLGAGSAAAQPAATAADGGADEPGRTDSDPASTMKQGAVKAAQAALAAARNAAKKVSSSAPGSSTTEETRPVAPTPPEMHYTAGAVRGSASVPLEETLPEGPGAHPDDETTPGPAPSVTPRPSAGPRRVRLAISRIDPWSVMKLAFLLSVAIAIMTVVATVVFWSVIDSLGVFDKIQDFVSEAIGDETNFNVMQYAEFERVVSLATLVAICNVVLLTALATIMTFLYNITAALVGGAHMTLTDD